MDELIKIIKQTALIATSIGALTLLGSVISNFAMWEWLTKFFIIVRNSLQLVDFIIDTNTLIILIGMTLSIQVAFWSFKAVKLLINFFR